MNGQSPVDSVVLWWLRRARWWKGFYLTLVITFVLFVAARIHPLAAVQVAVIWAVMVGAALWLSEKIKARRRR